MSEATTNPNSQNNRPNTGADSSAVAKRGQPLLAAGSFSSRVAAIAGETPANLPDADENSEQNSGRADHGRE